jgi:Transposase
VSEVARQHDISPQHLFAWRKAARVGLLSLPADEAPMFVPVVTELYRDEVTATSAYGRERITIEIGGVAYSIHRPRFLRRRIFHLVVTDLASTKPFER